MDFQRVFLNIVIFFFNSKKTEKAERQPVYLSKGILLKSCLICYLILDSNRPLKKKKDAEQSTSCISNGADNGT